MDKNRFYSILTVLIFMGFQLVSAASLTDNQNDINRKTIVKEFLERSSILFGLTHLANETQVDKDCLKDLQQIRQGVLNKELWALKALDSSGSKPASFMFGQNYWFGSREGCEAAGDTIKITLSRNLKRMMDYKTLTDVAPFDIEYRVIYISHQSPKQLDIRAFLMESIIHLGLCLPTACGVKEIEGLVQIYMSSEMFIQGTLYDIKPEVLYSKNLGLSESFFENRALYLSIAFIIATAILTASALWLRLKTNKLESKVDECDKKYSKREQKSESESIKSNVVTDFINCFDVVRNYDELNSPPIKNAKVIPLIFGLHTGAAFFVVGIHVMIYTLYTLHDRVFMHKISEKLQWQLITSIAMLVEVFFTLSGFLAAYQFLLNKKQMKVIEQQSFGRNSKLFLKVFLKRYLRFIPLYMFSNILANVMFSFIGHVSVFHILEHHENVCALFGWRQLLFIQNYFPLDEMCGNWFWYLAADMQFFIIITFILFVYAKNPVFAKKLFASTFTINILWTYIVAYRINYSLSIDVFFNTLTEVYTSPTIRILPYISGALVGWYWVERKAESIKDTFKQPLYWNLSFIIYFGLFCYALWRHWSPLVAATIYIVARLCFALNIGWMVMGSANGNSCWWSRFFSKDFFQRCSRFLYSAYIINPILSKFYLSLMNEAISSRWVLMYPIAFGMQFMMIPFIYFTVVFFELPYVHISELILKHSWFNENHKASESAEKVKKL